MPLVSSFSSGSSGDKYQVGQLRQSLRKYLGENWVKCDGSIIDETDYPELCEKMDITCDLENGWSEKQIATTSNDAVIQSVYYYNGTWAAIGHNSSTSTSYYPYLYYTTDPNGTWTEVKFYVRGGRTYSIQCYNGIWLVTGKNANQPYIWYTTNLSGSWTGKQLSCISGEYPDVKNIEYANGIYVATGYCSTTAYIWYTTDPTSGWNYLVLPNVTNSSGTTYGSSYVQKIKYYNGLWTIIGYTNNGRGFVYYTNDPTGTWNVKLISENASMAFDMSYHDGLYVAVGCDQVNASGYAYMYYTNDLTGTWTCKQMSTTTGTSIPFIKYYNGKWFKPTIGSYGLDYTEDPTGEWTTYSMASFTTQLSFKAIFCDKQCMIVSDNGANPYMYYHNNAYYQLPEANNTFIKVMENEYKLPTGYTRLEYIENNSDAYIDSGLVVNKTDTYEYMIDALFTNDTFAGANGYMQFKSGIASNTRSKIRVTYDGSSNVENIYVNNTLNSSTDWTDSYNGTNVKIGILKMGNADNTWYDNNAQTGKVYVQSIKKDGKLIRNYIPVMNDSGVVGLLDLVEKKFYGSATYTAFIAGTKLS